MSVVVVEYFACGEDVSLTSAGARVAPEAHPDGWVVAAGVKVGDEVLPGSGVGAGKGAGAVLSRVVVLSKTAAKSFWPRESTAHAPSANPAKRTLEFDPLATMACAPSSPEVPSC